MSLIDLSVDEFSSYFVSPSTGGNSLSFAPHDVSRFLTSFSVFSFQLVATMFTLLLYVNRMLTAQWKVIVN
jgi:hypothetical protein